MLFPKSKTSKKKNFLLESFGVCQNTVYDNGIIKTRKGIMPSDEILFQTGYTTENKFTLTEAVLFKNKRYNRLCVHMLALGGFRYRYDFRLVSETGAITEIAMIEIAENENGLRKPLNIFCFSAGATKGCGIYSFIDILHSGDKYELEIYELSKDLNEWIKLSESDIYIPDYLKNGRGADYLLSSEKLPEPQISEPLNMLGGVCRCSYTTDGHSRSFYLPVSSRDDKSDYIRVTYVADTFRTFEFSIPKNYSYSNSIDYDGYEIHLTYDNGFLRFDSSPYGFIPSRISGVNNNLKVLIKHDTVLDYEKDEFMRKASVMSLGGPGEQVVLTGNKKHPSLVMVSSPANPLYYPQSLSFNVGTDEDAVIGSVSVKNKLALFKDGSIYMAEIKNSKYSLSLISNNLGCFEAESVRSVGNAAMFVGNDSKIYALLSNGTIKEISAGIGEYLNDFKYVEQTCSSVSSGKYILFADTIAYCLDLNRSDAAFDKPVWDIWSLPAQMMLCGFFQHADRMVVLACTRDDTYKRYYICTFSGETVDSFYESYSYDMQLKEVPVYTTVKTGLINPDKSFSHKMLERVVFYVKSKGIVITKFHDDKGDIIKSSCINISYEKSGRKPIRLYPFMPAVQFGIMLQTELPLELEGIEFNYYNLD